MEVTMYERPQSIRSHIERHNAQARADQISTGITFTLPMQILDIRTIELRI